MSESDLGSYPGQIRWRVSEDRYFPWLASIRPGYNLERGFPSTFGKFSVFEVETRNSKIGRGNRVLEKEFRFLPITQVGFKEHVPLTIFHSFPINACVPDITVVFVLEVTGK